MIRDLINNNNIGDITYPLKEDFVEIVKVHSNKTVDVNMSFRPGFYVSCPLIGDYIPKEGEKGILYFIGSTKQVMVQPLKPSIVADFTNTEGVVHSYSLKKGVKAPSGLDPNNSANLHDALKDNPEYQKYMRSVASREDSWGTIEWVKVLLTAGKSFYLATNNILEINHLYNTTSHDGRGHHEGTGADAGSTPDALDVVANLTEANKFKVIAALNAFFNSGVKGIMWGLSWHSNQKLAKEVAEPFGYKLKWETSGKGKGDAKHIHHWHLSLRPRETKF